MVTVVCYIVYVFVGEHIALVDFVRCLQQRRLLERGEYVVISVDDEIYDPEHKRSIVQRGTDMNLCSRVRFQVIPLVRDFGIILKTWNKKRLRQDKFSWGRLFPSNDGINPRILIPVAERVKLSFSPLKRRGKMEIFCVAPRSYTFASKITMVVVVGGGDRDVKYCFVFLPHQLVRINDLLHLTMYVKVKWYRGVWIPNFAFNKDILSFYFNVKIGS